MTLLHTFSGYELSRFEKYLHSPYFNENEELRSLYTLLAKKLVAAGKGKEENAATEKKYLWQQLYGNLPYNDGQIRRLLSEITQHALHFMTLEYDQKEPIRTHVLSLSVLKDAELDIHFQGAIRQAEATQEKSNARNANFHLYQYWMEEQRYQYLEKTARNPEMFEDLAKADYHLDAYYIGQKLKNYCTWLDYQKIFSIASFFSLPPFFFDWIREGNYLEEPIIKGYFLLTQLLLFPDDDSNYYNLKSFLDNKEIKLGKVDEKAFYIFLINYCIDKKINIGKKEFFLELFHIYKILLDKNLLLDKGIFPSQDYKTIITVGLQVKEFAWTESFIQTYTPKLPPEERENALTYNLAKVYFAQNQYEKVIEQLREVEYGNLTYALGGKLMLLKTYYELNEFLALDSLVDSFRVYLRRNQTISKEVRQQYLNVLRFIKKMSNVRPGDLAAVAKIEQQIQACKNLADKGWIVQKLEELKGG